MPVKAFFNPLTGFSVMFPDQTSEDAARERMISAQRERTAADERMNERRANSQENVAKEYGSARRYEAEKGVESAKVTAEAMKERFVAQEKKVSEQLRRTIWSAANREEQRNKLARSAYEAGMAKVSEISKAMEDAAKSLKEPNEKDFWTDKGYARAKQDYDIQVATLRKAAAAEKMKNIPQGLSKYISVDPAGGTVVFNGDEPPEFNREQYMMDALKEFGVSFDNVFGGSGQDGGQGGQPAQNSTQAPSTAQPQPTQAPFAAKRVPPGPFIMTFDGKPAVLNEDGTMQPIPRGMAGALGVPQEMLVPVPSRIIP